MNVHKHSERFHFIWLIWADGYRKYWPAITDDFGELVPINATQVHYLLEL